MQVGSHSCPCLLPLESASDFAQVRWSPASEARQEQLDYSANPQRRSTDETNNPTPNQQEPPGHVSRFLAAFVECARTLCTKEIYRIGQGLLFRPSSSVYPLNVTSLELGQTFHPSLARKATRNRISNFNVKQTRAKTQSVPPQDSPFRRPTAGCQAQNVNGRLSTSKNRKGAEARDPSVDRVLKVTGRRIPAPQEGEHRLQLVRESSMHTASRAMVRP